MSPVQTIIISPAVVKLIKLLIWESHPDDIALHFSRDMYGENMLFSWRNMTLNERNFDILGEPRTSYCSATCSWWLCPLSETPARVLL